MLGLRDILGWLGYPGPGDKPQGRPYQTARPLVVVTPRPLKPKPR